VTNNNCLITVSLTNWHRNNCDKTLSEDHWVNILLYFFLLSEDHKWTFLYYFADFELHTTYYIDWFLLQLYTMFLLPNGIKLFETNSLLNIGIHQYNVLLHRSSSTNKLRNAKGEINTCAFWTCRLWIEQSGFEPWHGTLCCVLGQDTLLSQCLSRPRCINGYKWIKWCG